MALTLRRERAAVPVSDALLETHFALYAGYVKNTNTLTDALKERGSSTPAAEVMLLAQKDDRTAGKAPEELATMITQDASLLDDLKKTSAKLAEPTRQALGKAGADVETARLDLESAKKEVDVAVRSQRLAAARAVWRHRRLVCCATVGTL